MITLFPAASEAEGASEAAEVTGADDEESSTVEDGVLSSDEEFCSVGEEDDEGESESPVSLAVDDTFDEVGGGDAEVVEIDEVVLGEVGSAVGALLEVSSVGVVTVVSAVESSSSSVGVASAAAKVVV